MSYILDALKRAEAERHGITGPRPDLPTAFIAAPASRTTPRMAAWVAMPGAILLLGALAIKVLPATRTPDQPPAAIAQAQATLPQPAPASHAAAPPSAVIIPPHAGPAPMPPPDPVPVPTAAKPSTEATVGTLRDLPAQIQREIPPLAIGGFLYSANPSDRSVLINSRLRHEGDEVAPGLTLETLRQDGMVLNYRGYRYRTPY